MTPAELLALRERLGFTQRTLAEALGVAPNTVARWERGEIALTARTTAALDMLARVMPPPSDARARP